MRQTMVLLAGIYAIAIYVFIFLPVAVLVLFSFQGTLLPVPPFNGPSLRWIEAVFADHRLMAGLWNSFQVALSSSLLAVLFGFLAAYGFARFSFAGKRSINALLIAPLTVSYLIIGMGLLISFNWIGMPKSLAAAAIGHVVINMPLCFAIVYSQMGDHQVNIERAARDLGACQGWRLASQGRAGRAGNRTAPGQGCRGDGALHRQTQRDRLQESDQHRA